MYVVGCLGSKLGRRGLFAFEYRFDIVEIPARMPDSIYLYFWIAFEVLFHFHVFQRHRPGQGWKRVKIQTVESMLVENLLTKMLKNVGQ